MLAAALKEEGVYVGAGSVSSLLSKQRRQASTREGIGMMTMDMCKNNIYYIYTVRKEICRTGQNVYFTDVPCVLWDFFHMSYTFDFLQQ